MDNGKWAELLKYASPRNILVVTWDNRVIELRCPFRVEVVKDVGVLRVGSIALVQWVKISTSFITVFVIDDDAYYYHHFHILVD